MKLKPKQAHILFIFLVSVMMTAVMSLAILLLRVGWNQNFILIWLGDFAIGCLFSIPAGFILVPLIRKWIDKRTEA
ncbi:DUF2798 domain-containing protein [Algoriphagus sp.]|uniref:DUF2798 domain-containing protein n=1 Tax=Algoriphagus sp. TaxID=1872435 RepID=UPI0026223202|nr:DUF2798 domain-containing protein [Algoriphagus sp.]